MKKAGFLVFICTVLSIGIKAQIKNVHISGSYDAVFMLSGTSKDYKIAGSPYLSNSWMYGTIELKGEMVSKSIDNSKENVQLIQHAEIINKCNGLIQQISDLRYQTIALKLAMAEINQPNKDYVTDVKISSTDFDELHGIIKEFEEKLRAFLTEYRAEYESVVNENKRINGLFRYNLYAQEFEMIYDKDTLAIRAPFYVQSITFSNKKFIYGFYVDRNFGHDYLGSSYFEVLNEGSCKLLIRHYVKIKSNNGPVTYAWAGDESDSFVKYKQLYYQETDDTEVKLLKKSKKNLRKIFTDKYDEIEMYIRNEKINVKDENELIKAFAFYNSLDL